MFDGQIHFDGGIRDIAMSCEGKAKAAVNAMHAVMGTNLDGYFDAVKAGDTPSPYQTGAFEMYSTQLEKAKEEGCQGTAAPTTAGIGNWGTGAVTNMEVLRGAHVDADALPAHACACNGPTNASSHGPPLFAATQGTIARRRLPTHAACPPGWPAAVLRCEPAAAPMCARPLA